MIIQHFLILLFPLFISVEGQPGSNAPDMKIEVIVPVGAISIIIVLGLLLCYCFCNRSDYERVDEVDRLPSIRDETIPDSISVKIGSTRTMVLPDQRSNEQMHKHDYPKGLKNVGSECYMNSVIQALASSDIIVQQFRDIQDYMLNSLSLKYFLDLIDGVNNVDKHATSTSNSELLKHLIKEVGWKKISQQDSFDFLSCLVNGIHSGFKDVSDEIKFPLRFELLHRFSGDLNLDKVQFHMGLAVGLYGRYEEYPGVLLDDLIKECLYPLNIDGDPRRTTQTLFYKNFPKTLILHIQANKWDPLSQAMIKPQYHIRYSHQLLIDLPIVKSLNSQIINETVRYELSAVIVHMGNHKYRHYLTYRKFKGLWFMANDDQVERVSFDCSLSPYILLYEMKDSL